MELIKDIYFNTDKLIENTKVKVSYTGKFYQTNNEKVYLHYGYGENWDCVNELEMKKTDLGYQAEFTLFSSDTLNFCFKNQNNEWDNNYGKNYTFTIEKNLNHSTKNDSKTNNNNLTNICYKKNNNLDNPSNKFNNFSNPETSTNTQNSYLWNENSNYIDATHEEINSNNTSANINIENPANISTKSNVILVPTGFNRWSSKIKNTVSKLFSYFPKLISGNYKGKLFNNKK